jgi:glutamate racemase
MIAANIDYLVLGCSHYPYLIPQIKKILPKDIKIIDSGEAVARQTKNILLERNELNDQKNKAKAIFYSNANPNVLKDILNNKYDVITKDF